MRKTRLDGNAAKKFSRRSFLEASVAVSIATGVRSYLGTTELGNANSTDDGSSDRRIFRASEIEVLVLATDEIIPASGDMPAGSEAGSVAYLERLATSNADVTKNLTRTTGFLDGTSRERFQCAFQKLSGAQRLMVMREMELRSAYLFNAFRDLVYEAYYEQPRVWELIGYRFYATDHTAPAPAPFDPEILTQVRQRPSSFRAI
jgi:hypothetical protein